MRSGLIPSNSPLRFVVAVLATFLSGELTRAAVPFTIQGPGVNPADFRVTTFATALNYPIGMAELADGSILATSTDGPSFFNANSRLIRLVDANKDGLADGPGTVAFNGLTGGITSVQIGGPLVFVTGQNRPIAVLRMGATPASPFTSVGRLNITYPSGGWLHPHSALAVRPTPDEPGSYDLFFQVGSRVNFGLTTNTASLTSSNLGGLTGQLQGDAIYSLTFVDRTNSVLATRLTQIATGLRNPSGFAFHPENGDLYFEDNGIDGLVDANEPHGADELNILSAADIGGVIESFGFPASYTAYRTAEIVGGQGIQPLVAFQPIPSPITGAESEGPNDIAFAPPAFPEPLNHGVFVTFHGKFGQGGTANEENPLVFVDLRTTNYFHFIPPKLPGVGHLDGVLRIRDSLFISDMSTNGGLNQAAGRGAIYQVKAIVGPAVQLRTTPQLIELRWPHGTLQAAPEPAGAWTDLTNTSPYTFDPATNALRQRFFRTRN